MMKVYIERGDSMYTEMFKAHGWEQVEHLIDADIVQFTGGEDVSPSLYRHGVHIRTHFNAARDKRESMLYQIAQKNDIPCVGICRGGQFLNVMNGGFMWQDVDNHATANGHEVTDVETGDVFHATSTHHQMMSPGPNAMLIAVAYESSRREKTTANARTQVFFDAARGHSHPGDAEVIFYPKTKSLCFQPHPEFPGNDDLADRYFSYIWQYVYGDYGKEDEDERPFDEQGFRYGDPNAPSKRFPNMTNSELFEHLMRGT